MAAMLPPRGPLGNIWNYGEDEDNRRFWQTLKAHYIDHSDEDLLLAVVENVNEYLNII